jgi:hypothetical protein
MVCDDFLEQYSDFRDGLLPEGRGREMEEHLNGCSSCRRYTLVCLRGVEILSSLPPVTPSQDFAPRLHHRLLRADEVEVLSRDAGSGTTAATALAMALLLAVAAWSPVVSRVPEVEIPAIVISEPVPPPVQLRYQGSAFMADRGDWPPFRSLPPGHLLYEYSALNQRYSAQPSLVRAGLE